MKEWRAWCKEGSRPPTMPSTLDKTYKDGGWQGWGHWLGTGNTRTATKQFLPIAEALVVARSLGLASQKDWCAWCKAGRRPHNVPSRPSDTYKDGGWQGWGHWLGTDNQSSKAKRARFLPFADAMRVARSLRLASRKEWHAWCRSGARPANVPAAPDKVYVHDGWIGWEHFLRHANPDAAPAPGKLPRNTGKRAAASTDKGAAGSRTRKRLRR